MGRAFLFYNSTGTSAVSSYVFGSIHMTPGADATF